MKRLVSTLVSNLAVLVVFTATPRIAAADSKAECIAAFDSGQALRTSGKLTQSLAQFAVCARDVCPRSLQKACVDQATESSALLPSIVLSATDGTHAEVTDVKVSIDGAVVATVLDGKALSIDPGIHTFRFEKAGLPPVERQLAVKEAQKGQPIAVQIGPTEALAPLPVAPEPTSGQHWSTLRSVGFGAGVVGVVGVVVGSVFGSMAFSQWSSAQSQAKSASTFGQAAGTEGTGKTYATVSTAAFIAGGALLAGGIVLFVANPSKTVGGGPSAMVTPTPFGLAVVGAF